MITSVLIIIGSALLFAYWFRYTCLLILSTQRARNFEKSVADANGLTFLHLRGQVKKTEIDGLDNIYRSLERDYRVVTSLLRYAAAYNSGAQAFDQLLIRLDYTLMSWWYRIVHRVSETMARRALLEMAAVVSHLAHAMGERSAAATSRA